MSLVTVITIVLFILATLAFARAAARSIPTDVAWEWVAFALLTVAAMLLLWG